ncbi:hypothetical protein [Achromobacter sp. DH1f]|uniref:DUF5983 family protein n=1 Tax=Achromobacter sp. DH1f TaxID=1397275 RepID=UPI000469B41F|nr:hypothetical protein [Achromobacter sp. DH1f]
MSHASTSATCIFTVRRYTAVIHALFGSMDSKLEAVHSEAPGCRAYAFYMTDTDCVCEADTVWAGLTSLRRTLAIPATVVEPTREDTIRALFTYFKQPDHSALRVLLDQSDSGFIPIDTLYRLAEVFQDGHGLYSLSIEQGFWADKADLGIYGGAAHHCGSHYSAQVDTNAILAVASGLQSHLAEGRMSQAAGAMAACVQQLVAGIRDEQQRAQVMDKLVADLLSAPDPSASGAGNGHPERLTTIVLSSAHVPDREAPAPYLASAGEPIRYGWLWKVPERLPEVRQHLQLPEWMVPILAFADSVGAHRIEFDADGELVIGLAMYD